MCRAVIASCATVGWHAFVGVRSLLKDVGLTTTGKRALKAAVVVIHAAIAAIVFAAWIL